MIILEKIHDYLLGCPLLGNGKLNVDYLPEDAQGDIEYSVDTVPFDEVLSQYSRGAALCQYQFNVASVNEYSLEAITQIEGSGFFEQLAAWFREQTARHNFPDLGTGYTPIRIEAMSTGYLSTSEIDRAKYQIQCRLIYHRKKGY